MLIIRQAQLDEIGKIKLNNFIQHMFDYLRKTFEKKFQKLSNDELVHFIEVGIEKAQSYEIKTEIHISKYIVIMTKLNNYFDQQAWANRILRNAYRDVDSALMKLEDKTESLINTKK